MTQAIAQAIPDMLPEYYPYRDLGCEVSATCLRCPLPQCKYDNPGWLQREKRYDRDRQVIYALHSDGLSAPEAAVRFDLSQRTIFRILKRTQGDV